MIFAPQNSQQRQVVETQAKLTVVLGGAGVGKTTSALAAARAHLDRTTDVDPTGRVLFLSFSRASVARISSRTQSILGRASERVDVMTFHALAFSLVRRFGRLVGHPTPVLVSPARQRIGKKRGEVGYEDLFPLALQVAKASPAVRKHVGSRWSLVIVDEFQDTGDAQQQLLELVTPNSRVILLGDPEQCIYTFLASDGVRYEKIIEASESAGRNNTIVLPPTSFRDPTGVIPAVATAIRQRRFKSPVLSEAVAQGRLRIQSGIPLSEETSEVARVVRALRDEGLGVAVFTHHNDMLATLSDALEEAGIQHEIAGLSDAVASALDAQAAMLRFGVGYAAWDVVLDALAVFVTSAQRGSRVPQLAHRLLTGNGDAALKERLSSLKASLHDSRDIEDLSTTAISARQSLKLPSKSSAWEQASTLLSTMQARALRLSGHGSDMQKIAVSISAQAREASFDALTESSLNLRDVQLMNLYQTKGREADATVVVLREGDFLGSEKEPFPTTSRLLYVVFSRARQKIVVLLVGSVLHPAVAPLRLLPQAPFRSL
ncbi:UvrD-helicase domain-containing protein [Paenarthrobacter sp. YJN-D]|uniref:UvrD-helicase domain-containing protein n=1 Tax=Paenarthrobacter sp. YJN-D TaxID=2735317 RepID=UPI001877C69D|nr:UvrD-helicase domain-containing protein [Paenarthrobacter sp. YJN-D]QOT23069.1 ATP-dependent helicase [Paenarthrobacter sp. YJN-D]